jgi:hypothetical protein
MSTIRPLAFLSNDLNDPEIITRKSSKIDLISLGYADWCFKNLHFFRFLRFIVSKKLLNKVGKNLIKFFKCSKRKNTKIHFLRHWSVSVNISYVIKMKLKLYSNK